MKSFVFIGLVLSFSLIVSSAFAAPQNLQCTSKNAAINLMAIGETYELLVFSPSTSTLELIDKMKCEFAPSNEMFFKCEVKKDDIVISASSQMVISGGQTNLEVTLAKANKQSFRFKINECKLN